MLDIEKVKKHQKEFLARQKDRKEPIFITIEGIEIKVNPGVFPPATDTKLLAANIHVKPGERILDLTTGSGIFSVIAGNQGATGVAVDINSAAVANAKESIAASEVKMRVIQSDLFRDVPQEKFDQIFANGPFFEGPITDPLDHACYGAKKFIEELMLGLGNYLKQNGKLLIVLSVWSDLKHFRETIKKNHLRAKEIDQRKSDDGERGYNLYEVKLEKI